jgi:D-alanyl-lipoteichoic acid acyltransferase DltB (MBOAT superfamily)
MALNSFAYFLHATLAVLLIPITRGWLRVTLFLSLNLAFVWTYWGGATPVALAYCLAGYLCAWLVRGRGTAALAASVTALTAAFIYLRGYAGVNVADVPTASSGLAFAGLSFLFFKMVHVVVDAASGSVEQLSLGRYLNYCLNFTTVLMGPIQRYQDFSAQWTNEAATIGFEASVDAVNRALRGLLKAFVLAPLLAPYVLRSGLPIESLGGADLLLRIYAFYVFLYLDFSGYCDIVIGVGSLMGLRPPENFRFPFLARNVSEYWLRVHRSLTLWLTDYIFTPVYRAVLRARGSSGHAFLTLAASLIVTMLVAGAWHGARWHFVLFGLVHGIALVVVRGYDSTMVRWMGRQGFRRFAETPLVTAGSVFLTYNVTSLAYLFFVLNVSEVGRVMNRLAGSAAGLVR